MRAVIQRVTSTSVSINGLLHAAIGKGFLVLTGIEEEDSEDDLDYLAAKIAAMRVFADDEGKMNLDIRQAGGSLLVVSQFTLHASTKKGNRPSPVPLFTFLPELTWVKRRFFPNGWR